MLGILLTISGKPLIERGELNKFLHNCGFANKEVLGEDGYVQLVACENIDNRVEQMGKSKPWKVYKKKEK